MDKQIAKNNRRMRRKARTRSKIRGTKECPRLSVYRSTRYVYAQLIDDNTGKTLVAVHSSSIKDLKVSKDDKMGLKSLAAFETGKLIAEKAKEAKVDMIIFDRGPYLYHGRVKALADGAREGGLIF